MGLRADHLRHIALDRRAGVGAIGTSASDEPNAERQDHLGAGGSTASPPALRYLPCLQLAADTQTRTPSLECRLAGDNVTGDVASRSNALLARASACLHNKSAGS